MLPTQRMRSTLLVVRVHRERHCAWSGAQPFESLAPWHGTENRDDITAIERRMGRSRAKGGDGSKLLAIVRH